MTDAQKKNYEEEMLSTGANHPYGGGLPIIILESDSRGGSSYVKRPDGFWWYINAWRDRDNELRVVTEQIVTKSDDHIKKLARKARGL